MRLQEIAAESIERMKTMPRALESHRPALDPADVAREEMDRRLTRARVELPPRWRTVAPAEAAPDGSLFLHGTLGTGKTHRAVGLALAAAVLPDLQRLPRWCSTPLWLAETRSSFNGGQPARDHRHFTDTGLLIIDDLGVEKGSEWAQESIYCLIEAVYERETLCIITSNLSLSELSQRLGARISSRIAEMCAIEKMVGPDRRVEMARAR
jgi:DNA replication protein DnaC